MRLNVGDEIGRLKILEIIPPRYHSIAKVKCKCGKEKIVQLTNLVQGRTKSCGCLRKEKFRAYIKKKFAT